MTVWFYVHWSCLLALNYGMHGFLLVVAFGNELSEITCVCVYPGLIGEVAGDHLEGRLQDSVSNVNNTLPQWLAAKKFSSIQPVVLGRRRLEE